MAIPAFNKFHAKNDLYTQNQNKNNSVGCHIKHPKTTSHSIHCLPPELLAYLFDFFTYSEKILLKLVCKVWRDLCDDEKYWRMFARAKSIPYKIQKTDKKKKKTSQIIRSNLQDRFTSLENLPKKRIWKSYIKNSKNLDGLGNLIKYREDFVVYLTLSNYCKLKFSSHDARNRTAIEKWLKKNIKSINDEDELELFINKKELTELPESIGKVTSLILLDVSDNYLTKLPSSFNALTSLVVLILNNNKLTELPESVGTLTNLAGLHLDGNQLQKLPNSIVALTALEQLSLNGNQLTNIPLSISTFASLFLLKMNGNNLTEIPASIGTLTSLEELHLNNNKITKIPREIGALTVLRELHLSKNNLKNIPDSVGKISSLTEVDVSDNIRLQIPESIIKNKNITLIR